TSWIVRKPQSGAAIRVSIRNGLGEAWRRTGSGGVVPTPVTVDQTWAVSPVLVWKTRNDDAEVPDRIVNREPALSVKGQVVMVGASPVRTSAVAPSVGIVGAADVFATSVSIVPYGTEFTRQPTFSNTTCPDGRGMPGVMTRSGVMLNADANAAV